MEHIIFVPVIYREEKLQKVNLLLSLIESRIPGKKKIVVGVYTNTLFDQGLIDQLSLSDNCQVFLYVNKDFNFFEGLYVEAITKSVEELSPQMVIAFSDEFMKSILARVAVRFSAGFAVDCFDIQFDESAGKFVYLKPAYGTNINAKISIKDSSIMFVTVKLKSSIECLYQKSGNIEVLRKQLEIGNRYEVSFIEKIVDETIDNKLESAKIVIGVGRGIKDKENLKYAYELANILGGAVGVTRPLVDLGWAGKELQIGQSGKVISPDIYFAFGISGAAHHICGIGKPKLLIAINKNKDAEIFKIANYGIVADAVQTMKSFIRVFKERLEKC